LALAKQKEREKNRGKYADPQGWSYLSKNNKRERE